MSDNILVCPRIAYLSGKECTLPQCDTVVDIILRLCVLHAWIPHEIMVLVDGKKLVDDDPAPETASVLWKESQEWDGRLWRRDLELLARVGYQAGANRCALKVVSLDTRLASDDFVNASICGGFEAYPIPGRNAPPGISAFCLVSCVSF